VDVILSYSSFCEELKQIPPFPLYHLQGNKRCMLGPQIKRSFW
jgi:hypothetical protein